MLLVVDGCTQQPSGVVLQGERTVGHQGLTNILLTVETEHSGIPG